MVALHEAGAQMGWSEKQTFEKFNPQLVSAVMADVTTTEGLHGDSRLPQSEGPLGGRLEEVWWLERERRNCHKIYRQHVS